MASPGMHDFGGTNIPTSFAASNECLLQLENVQLEAGGAMVGKYRTPGSGKRPILPDPQSLTPRLWGGSRRGDRFRLRPRTSRSSHPGEGLGHKQVAALADKTPKPPLSQKNGAPAAIRTRDPQIRNLLLYPTELRGLDYATLDYATIEYRVKGKAAHIRVRRATLYSDSVGRVLYSTSRVDFRKKRP